MQDSAKRRYESGYISSPDLKRVAVQLKESEYQLKQYQSLLSTENKNLKILLGLAEGDTLSLTSRVDLAKKFMHINRSSLSKIAKIENNNDVLIKNLTFRKSEKEAAAVSYYYFPELSLGLDYTEKKESSFKVSFSWDLFSGGIDHYRHKQAVSERGRSFLDYKKEQRKNRMEVIAAINNIVLLKDDFIIQKSILKDYKDILKSSETSFMTGAISSQDLSVDLKNYTRQKDRFIEKNHEIIVAFYEFSNLVSEMTVFGDLLL